MTEDIKRIIDSDLDRIINDYNSSMELMFTETKGGKIRGAKGKLVEKIAKELVYLTWTKVLNQSLVGFDINQNKQEIFIKDYRKYLLRKDISKDEHDRIKKEHKKITYDFSTDIHVEVDQKLAIAIECKAYTESAMLKRIIFDSMLMDEALPDATHCLFQLESAFSNDQYYVLMSHHAHNIDVLTLLDGKRNSKKPIHKQEYFKELKKDALIFVVEYFEKVLKKFVR